MHDRHGLPAAHLPGGDHEWNALETSKRTWPYRHVSHSSPGLSRHLATSRSACFVLPRVVSRQCSRCTIKSAPVDVLCTSTGHPSCSPNWRRSAEHYGRRRRLMCTRVNSTCVHTCTTPVVPSVRDSAQGTCRVHCVCSPSRWRPPDPSGGCAHSTGPAGHPSAPLPLSATGRHAVRHGPMSVWWWLYTCGQRAPKRAPVVVTLAPGGRRRCLRPIPKRLALVTPRWEQE